VTELGEVTQNTLVPGWGSPTSCIRAWAGKPQTLLSVLPASVPHTLSQQPLRGCLRLKPVSFQRGGNAPIWGAEALRAWLGAG